MMKCIFLKERLLVLFCELNGCVFKIKKKVFDLILKVFIGRYFVYKIRVIKKYFMWYNICGFV